MVVHFDESALRKQLEKGDLVFMKLGSEWVVHRLMDEQKTKGDRSLFFDEGPSQLWGRVDGFSRNSQSYFWGERGMTFKKSIAFLSMKAGSHRKLQRWIYLSVLWGLVKISLIFSKSQKKL